MTSVPGLFAAGASSDGMNISPSLNLSWCMVLGWWAGKYAADFSQKGANDGLVSMAQVDSLSASYERYFDENRSSSFDAVHGEASKALEALGVVLTDTNLSSTRRELSDILDQYGNVRAFDPHDRVKVLGLRNAIESLVVVMSYLLHRRESRGSVINVDHPDVDNVDWLTLTRSRVYDKSRLEIWDDPIPRNEFYIHYKPKSGRRRHPFFEAVGTDQTLVG